MIIQLAFCGFWAGFCLVFFLSVFILLAFGFCLFGVYDWLGDFIIGLGFLVGWLVHCLGFLVINFWLSRKYFHMHLCFPLPSMIFLDNSLYFSWSLCLHLSFPHISQALVSWRMAPLLCDETFLEPDGDSVIENSVGPLGHRNSFSEAWICSDSRFRDQFLSLKSGKKAQETDWSLLDAKHCSLSLFSFSHCFPAPLSSSIHTYCRGFCSGQQEI